MHNFADYKGLFGLTYLCLLWDIISRETVEGDYYGNN